MQKFLSCVCAFVLAAASALAQSSSGTISGRVVDSTGATIAGAEVHAINQVDKNTRTFATTARGAATTTTCWPRSHML